MIDFICIEAIIRCVMPYKFGQTQPFKWNDIEFVPRYGNDVEQSVTKYTGYYQNLRISLYYNKIRIENSLHKFCKRNNYSDFRRTEVNNVIDKLCKKFNIEADSWEIIKLEFGFNIQTPLPAKTYIPLFLYCKGNKFQDVMYKNQCFERKCFFTEYAIKCYDKSAQTKVQERTDISKNLFRAEICYNQKRRLPEGVKTLANLQTEKGIQALWADFENLISRIVIADEYNYDNLNTATLEERSLFFASLHPDFLKIKKESNKKEQKAMKVKIKRLRETFFKKNFKCFLEKSLKSKYIELYCS